MVFNAEAAIRTIIADEFDDVTVSVYEVDGTMTNYMPFRAMVILPTGGVDLVDAAPLYYNTADIECIGTTWEEVREMSADLRFFLRNLPRTEVSGEYIYDVQSTGTGLPDRDSIHDWPSILRSYTFLMLSLIHISEPTRPY